jgi:hypothetical protein
MQCVERLYRSVTLLQMFPLLPEIHPAPAAEINLFLQQLNDSKPNFTALDFSP